MAAAGRTAVDHIVAGRTVVGQAVDIRPVDHMVAGRAVDIRPVGHTVVGQAVDIHSVGRNRSAVHYKGPLVAEGAAYWSRRHRIGRADWGLVPD